MRTLKFRMYAEFFSKIKAQKFIEDEIDKCNPKTEYIPYEG